MEYLFSIFWKNIRIGILYYYDNKFRFEYDKDGITITRELGFDKLIGFPDINQIYVSKTLFPIFSSRIISPKRSSLITRQEKIDFLIKTKGKLMTDYISIKYEDKKYVKSRI